jgi:hypothetical protein
VAPAIQPRALILLKVGAVGFHYLLGGIGTTWAFFLARIISGINKVLFLFSRLVLFVDIFLNLTLI